MLEFSEWLLEDEELGKELKNQASDGWKSYKRKKKDSKDQDERKHLLEKLFATNDEKKMAEIMKQIHDKGYSYMRGKLKKTEPKEDLKKWMHEEFNRKNTCLERLAKCRCSKVS